MPLSREKKEQQVTDLLSHLQNDNALVFLNFQGLKANEIADLRKKVSQSAGKLKVIKNTLLQIALKKNKKVIPESVYNQPLALAMAADELELAKLLYQFGKEHEKLQILGAIIAGHFEDKDEIVKLALLPSRQELEAKIVGSLSGLIFRLNYSLKSNMYKLTNILKQAEKA